MNRVQVKFVEDAIEKEDKLSEWEREFIDNLYHKPTDYELSEKQNQILNRITSKLNRYP